MPRLTAKVDKAFIDAAGETARSRLSIQIDAIRADRSLTKQQRQEIVATIMGKRQIEIKAARQEAMKQEKARVNTVRRIDRYAALTPPPPKKGGPRGPSPGA